MPNQVGWFFHDRGRIWIEPECVIVGGLLNAHASRSGKVVRDHAECYAVIVPDHSAIQGAGEIFTR